MILLIDNYDSFVHNLARHVGLLGFARRVMRNDAITVSEIAADPPEAIILSPGPCTPRESGVCMDVIAEFHQSIPILGICLGHQCLGEAFGGRTVRAPRPVHGRASFIEHGGAGLFAGLPSPLQGGRYHSLVTDLPDSSPLRVTARARDDGSIMAFAHRDHPVYGLQFHPESVLTEHGLALLKNFFPLTAEQRKAA